MRALRGIAVLGVMAGLLGGCEGTMTGTEVVRMELQPAAERGAYAPAKFNLSTDMNPVAINFRAEFVAESTEYGRWNTYRVALTQNGATVASRNMNINHPQRLTAGEGGGPPPPSDAVHTLFITDLQANGEYELTITPVKPVEVTLRNARVDVRRNVARPPV